MKVFIVLCLLVTFSAHAVCIAPGFEETASGASNEESVANLQTLVDRRCGRDEYTWSQKITPYRHTSEVIEGVETFFTSARFRCCMSW